MPTYEGKAAVFDLDGTLVDTLPDLWRVTNAVLAEEGLAPLAREQVRRMIGDGVRRLVERAFAAAGRPLADGELDRLHRRFLDLYEADPHRDSRLPEGVVEALVALRDDGFRLAVCTNKPQRPSLAILEAFDLARHFALVVGGDVLPVRKPDPGPLRHVLARLGVAPARAVMVGDSRNDRLTARAAGVPCVLLAEGYGEHRAEELAPEAVVTGFAEVPAAVRRLVDGD